MSLIINIMAVMALVISTIAIILPNRTQNQGDLHSIKEAAVMAWGNNFVKRLFSNNNNKETVDDKLSQELNQAIADLNIKPNTLTEDEVSEYLISKLKHRYFNNPNLSNILKVQLKELLIAKIKHGDYQIKDGNKLSLQIDLKTEYLKCCEPYVVDTTRHDGYWSALSTNDIFKGAISLIKQLQAKDIHLGKQELIGQVSGRYYKATQILKTVLQRVADNFVPDTVVFPITNKVCLCTFPNRERWLIGLTNISYQDFFNNWATDTDTAERNLPYLLADLLSQIGDEIGRMIKVTNCQTEGILDVTLNACKAGD